MYDVMCVLFAFTNFLLCFSVYTQFNDDVRLLPGRVVCVCLQTCTYKKCAPVSCRQSVGLNVMVGV